ncbi:MAG: 6,7-dimethyl-8-ribityllumazine synthase [Betaproteobacteria bacterium]|nr:6,7-dimethyl-8-ribityllumazine synthase [Betaproteobacteria bacterium]
MNSIKKNPDGRGLRIGIVQSRFNEPVVVKMLDACVKALREGGVADTNIGHVSVPGALEIPVALQAMALTRRYDALIAIGAVIRGETYHFEVVSNESCRGVMDVMLQTGVPIANGILTVESDAQAEARVSEKGADCAHAAIEMANALVAIASSNPEAR